MVICIIFTLTFEGCVKSWSQTLPATSIRLIQQFVDEFLPTFEGYSYQKIFENMNKLRMKLGESLDPFISRFNYIFYAFPERDVDWTYLWEKCATFVFFSPEKFELELITDDSNNLQSTNQQCFIPTCVSFSNETQGESHAFNVEIVSPNSYHPPLFSFRNEMNYCTNIEISISRESDNEKICKKRNQVVMVLEVYKTPFK